MATNDGDFGERADAVVRVGDGRGFLVETTRRYRFVITAAHCLPYLPPAHPYSYLHERTYENVVGPIGGTPAIWAECVFVDPIADLAVLAEPDNQALSDQADAYEQFTADRPVLRVIGTNRRSPDPRAAKVSLLTLDGQWSECAAKVYGPALTLIGANLVGGMSGSPIITGADVLLAWSASVMNTTASNRTNSLGNRCSPPISQCGYSLS
jgi:hypothetical protein